MAHILNNARTQKPWHNVEIPEGYTFMSEEDYVQTLRDMLLSKNVVEFSTCGTISNAVEVDDWTTDQPEILVDCE
jgi:hypothetical protein